MSRTNKGAKGSGCEYWSRRPTKYQFPTPGKIVKKDTHKKERKLGKDVVDEQTNS